jgi:hypothetical protein
MHQFIDTAGRTWQLALTISGVKRVKSLLHVDLLNPLGAKPRKVRGVARKGRPLVTRLQLDPALLIDCIFALVKPQADHLGVTDEQFGEALGGEAAYAAYEAFMGEWQAFFRGLRREAEAKAIEANMKLVLAEDSKDAAMVDRATEAAVLVAERKRQQATAKLDALARGPSPIATDSPASSESTPPA